MDSDIARAGTLAEALLARKRRILEVWAEQTRHTIGPASQFDKEGLLDGVPTLIDELAHDLASGSGDVPEGSANAVAHARQRAAAGFTLDQLFVEYELLRSTILRSLGEHPAFAVADCERIHQRVHVWVRAAVHEHARLLDEERERARARIQAAHDDLEQRVRERTKDLARAESRFGLLVAGVKDYAIFTLDPQGIVTSWNDGAARVKGYAAEEILGTHFGRLYTEEGRRRNEPMDHLRSALTEGRFRGEGNRVRKNGEEYLADVLITPMFEGETHVGFSKVVQDLTERSLMLQERDLLRSDAERLRVEAAYRERFVAGLSHDLRSPLSAAKVGAELIARAPERADRVRQWAFRIADAVERADRLVVDLLDVSRLDAGEKMSLTLADCDIQQIAEDVCADLTTRHGSRFVLESSGDTHGYWNADALWRVLENLLTNAIKYGEPGAMVTVRLRRVDERMISTVHNRGTIIPVEEQARLFQPYHRTAEAKASGTQGWGLGLPLVRGIVEALHGEVKVESYPVEGTTFTVDLPVDPRPAPAPAPAPA